LQKLQRLARNLKNWFEDRIPQKYAYYIFYSPQKQEIFILKTTGGSPYPGLSPALFFTQCNDRKTQNSSALFLLFRLIRHELLRQQAPNTGTCCKNFLDQIDLIYLSFVSTVILDITFLP